MPRASPPRAGWSGPGTGRSWTLCGSDKWHYGGPETPGMFAAVIHACMAVGARDCAATCSSTGPSTRRLRGAVDRTRRGRSGGVDRDDAVDAPLRRLLRAQLMGLWATRHMHEFGTTREQFAAVALNARRNAKLNPKAVMQGELTMDDYLSSKMISEPLCLFDCDIAVDGATAVDVSTVEHAPDSRAPPIQVEAVGSALTGARRGTSGRT